ncbi:MAG TPA: hypothetical protein PL041_10580 [Melioribacteraceae bacterium]|nr:hypothetical protein [Melioribacteraceae bacterium]
MSKNSIISYGMAKDYLARLSEDFAIIYNPQNVFPPYEIIPIAHKINSKRNHIAAFVTDMDGTTTTTEELCLYSLEYMIRVMSGKFTVVEWHGLDKTIDYPNIIGNSTTKHIEFLVNRYNNFFNKSFIEKAYIKAIVWQLIYGKDKTRKEEIINNIKLFKIENIIDDSQFKALGLKTDVKDYDTNDKLIYLMQNYSPCFDEKIFTHLVKLGIDIYYYKYHEILNRIYNGESKHIAKDLFNDENKALIEPMPGIITFLALIKGKLKDYTDYFVNILIDDYKHKAGDPLFKFDENIIKEILFKLSEYFEKNPAKIGIVTSSIFYEANIVLNEVFSEIRKKVQSFSIPIELKELLLEFFDDYNKVYNTIVTASDSNEIRLKPHRDLYSIALQNLHVPKEEFINVIGVEDSESGTFAIRSAGVGCSVAVPFAQTSSHNFEAASIIAKGGIPELILTYKLLLL